MMEKEFIWLAVAIGSLAVALVALLMHILR